MLDFEPIAEQAEAQAFLRKWAFERMRPVAIEFDRREHEKPWALIEEVNDLASKGVLGFRRHHDPSLDGSSSDLTNRRGMTNVLLVEELAYGSASLALGFPGPSLAGAAILASGTDSQRKKFLARYLDGTPRFGAMAVTEPGCGSDVAALRATAVRDGDGWVLNGRKVFCTNGASADIVVVWATIDPDAGRRGISAFVVEKGTPGFVIGRLEHKLGIRASETAELALEDCRIPLDSMLGADESGQTAKPRDFKGVMKTFDATRPGVAAMAVGIARASIEYLQDRLREEGWQGPAYGQSRTSLSALDDAFIQMEADVEAARALVHRSAWLLDQQQANQIEAAMGKAKAGRVVVDVTAKVVELLGPTGITRDHPAEMWLRDSKVFDIFEGTGQINRLVIARRKLGYKRDKLP